MPRYPGAFLISGSWYSAFVMDLHPVAVTFLPHYLKTTFLVNTHCGLIVFVHIQMNMIHSF